MIEKKDKQVLKSNFISLFLLQGSNYILPLIIFPYIIQVIGIENFGLLSFAVALIAYLNIITDYGFNLTATNKISINRTNTDKTTEIFSAIMSIKFILMCLSFIILLILIFSIKFLNENMEIFIITFGTVIGNMLFPIWFFQGMEKMKYITYINIMTRLLFTISIFIFLNTKDDIYVIPLLNSLGGILSGIIAIIYIKKDFKISFKLQSIDTLKIYLIDGWYIFKTYMFVSLYTNSNILILGFFTNNTLVGYYSIAEKIISIVGNLFTPINQTVYPYLSNLYIKNKNLFKKVYSNIIILYIVLSLIIFILLSIFRDEIIILINGNYNDNIGDVYNILRFLIFTFPFGAFFASIMNILLLKQEISKIIIRASLINIVFAPFAIILFGIIGLAVINVLIQYYIMFYYYKKIKEKNG